MGELAGGERCFTARDRKSKIGGVFPSVLNLNERVHEFSANTGYTR